MKIKREQARQAPPKWVVSPPKKLVYPTTWQANDNNRFGAPDRKYPNCTYKSVMTDEDYGNCGINPPR